ncbi:ArsR/SmtB family transcription factor [Aliamphritea ceti]|uniref:ArsR/SmtB family transcription factor n=1 Tax=Aliamphritea ceti TaxID=1524258 RepID=UPI0021C2E044|nr:metalloregulator ArsR/SmtB family transcription factor [Aliamphritea ceti]
MEASAQFFKALSEPVRLRLLNILNQHDEVCVCDLVDCLGISQSLASRHLAYLRNSGLVQARREGVWMHYRLQGDAWQISWLKEMLDQLAKREQQLVTDLQTLTELACCNAAEN